MEKYFSKKRKDTFVGRDTNKTKRQHRDQDQQHYGVDNDGHGSVAGSTPIFANGRAKNRGYQNTSEDNYQLEQDCMKIMHDAMTKIRELNDCPALLRNFLFHLLDYKGEIIGLKRQLMLQLLETGVQVHYNLEATCELLMCDEELWFLRRAVEQIVMD